MIEDTLPKNNVVELVLPERNNEKPTFKIVDKPHPAYGCRHMNCEVNEHTRTVTCNHCGKTVDPFDWMLQAAKEERRIYSAALDVDNETKKRRKAIEEMKRVERNYKSRIRNAKKNLDDPLFNNIEEAIEGLSRSPKMKMEAEYFIEYLKRITAPAGEVE